VDAVGQRAKDDLPGVITSERTVSHRKKGTVLLDALQNARGKPLASVYSARPFPGAPVSTPIDPAELSKEIRPAAFNIKTIFQRVEKTGDLWADFWEHRHRLEDIVAKA
jgi:bifunctional non-homologous end joining protein LigD